MGRWKEWGWGTGRSKPLEAEIATIKARPCTGNAPTRFRDLACRPKASGPCDAAGEGTGSPGPGPQGPAQPCTEVRTKTHPVLLQALSEGEGLGQSGSHFTCHPGPRMAQDLPAASRPDRPCQTQQVSGPSPSRSQRTA